MKHIIIGTAGHIDHGKTTLIKALTGRDTDTLKEEKERGISINLGFTYFDLPSGKRAGIVDVPGHERFIKNMLAGVSGIDMVLLVIAADEGIMPQTREHLNILSLLEVKKGIVAVTKKDMVDKEWLDVVIEDIKEYLKGTFLENADIIAVSSVTGDGLDSLVKSIDKIAGEVQEKDSDSCFRLPVDRVFTVSGFGTVITGTLISGMVSEGDKIEIYPSGMQSKVRNIQVHENSVKTAFAGQRVAINLSNISVDEIKRGNVAAQLGCMEPSMMIDCRLKYLKDAPRPLKNRDRVRVYHGTSELFGRMVLLDKEVVNPGDSCLVQIRLESPISAIGGDKYVIRSYSPMVTIGGGTIIDPNPSKHKRFDDRVLDELMTREKGKPGLIVEQMLLKNSSQFPGVSKLAKLSGRNESEIKTVLNDLISRGRAVCFNTAEGMGYCHADYIKSIEDTLKNYLNRFHEKYPLRIGASKEEVKTRLFEGGVKQKLFDDIMAMMEQRRSVKIDGKHVSLYGFIPSLNQEQQRIRNKIMDAYKADLVDAPKPNDVISSIKEDEANSKAVLDFLIDTGELVKIGEENIISRDAYDYAAQKLKEYLKENGEITLSQYRDMLNISRKAALSLLEHFDRIKITKRVGDRRVPYLMH